MKFFEWFMEEAFKKGYEEYGMVGIVGGILGLTIAPFLIYLIYDIDLLDYCKESLIAGGPPVCPTWVQAAALVLGAGAAIVGAAGVGEGWRLLLKAIKGTR